MFIQVYLYIFYIQMYFAKSVPEWMLMDKVDFKASFQNTLKHTLSHKLHYGIQFVKYTLMYFDIKYTWMNISSFSQFS